MQWHAVIDSIQYNPFAATDDDMLIAAQFGQKPNSAKLIINYTISTYLTNCQWLNSTKVKKVKLNPLNCWKNEKMAIFDTVFCPFKTATPPLPEDSWKLLKCTGGWVWSNV